MPRPEMNRTQSTRTLISNQQPERPFDHGLTAVYLLVFGAYLAAIGLAMTGLAFGYETYPRIHERPHHDNTTFVSVAMRFKARCDIAGPVLLSVGGAGLLASFILISVFGVCTTPEWLRKSKEQPPESVIPSIQTVTTSRF